MPTFSPVIELSRESEVARLDLMQLFGRNAPLHVDLGCGDGRITALLAEKLPATSIISIGHRSTLDAFHQRNIAMIRDGDQFKLQDRSGVRPAAG